MEALVLHNAQSRFEMALARPDDDPLIVVRVKSRGFEGANELYVEREALVAFCRALASLQRNLSGEASLESMSPEELRIRVYAATSRGNLAVSGKLGYHLHDENSVHWHCVEFGFEFEQTQLSEAVRVSWIREYAG